MLENIFATRNAWTYCFYSSLSMALQVSLNKWLDLHLCGPFHHVAFFIFMGSWRDLKGKFWVQHCLLVWICISFYEHDVSLNEPCSSLLNCIMDYHLLHYIRRISLWLFKYPYPNLRSRVQSVYHLYSLLLNYVQKHEIRISS